MLFFDAKTKFLNFCFLDVKFMRFKNNIGFMLVMAFILLLTVSLVSASEVDSDVGVISNDNELLASNVGYVENGVPSDLNLKSTENVEMDDSW